MPLLDESPTYPASIKGGSRSAAEFPMEFLVNTFYRKVRFSPYCCVVCLPDSKPVQLNCSYTLLLFNASQFFFDFDSLTGQPGSNQQHRFSRIARDVIAFKWRVSNYNSFSLKQLIVSLIKLIFVL